MSLAPVSVVIPTYNSAALVEQAVDSVLAQTLAPAEIIVVDDGSKDDTATRLQRYGDQVRYVFQPNQGVAVARNRGVEQATGDFVAFLDADDVWHPRKLELQMQVLAEHPDLGLLGTADFTWPTSTLPALPPRKADMLMPIPWKRLVVRNYLATSSVVVRRQWLLEAGPFDPALQGPEDYDLWLRIAERTKLAKLQMPLLGYRFVAGSLSRQAATMQAGMCRILQKLDERSVWRGRWLLRCKARSYCYDSCAWMYSVAGDNWTAIRYLLKSMVWYPLPFRRGEVSCRFERPKFLVLTLARLMGLRAPPLEYALYHAPEVGG